MHPIEWNLRLPVSLRRGGIAGGPVRVMNCFSTSAVFRPTIR
jgi:hypothetical protein